MEFASIDKKFMADYFLDSNRANQPLWNSESQDSRSGYMSFWLCISWQFSSGFKCRSGHVDSNFLLQKAYLNWILKNILPFNQLFNFKNSAWLCFAAAWEMFWKICCDFGKHYVNTDSPLVNKMIILHKTNAEFLD